MKLRWTAIEHKQHVSTAKWQHLHNIRGKEDTLSQVAKVYSLNPDQPPALFILTFHKTIRDGLFIVSFNPEQPGTAGVVFRYTNHHNYYLLEVGGCNKPFARFRKVVNG